MHFFKLSETKKNDRASRFAEDLRAVSFPDITCEICQSTCISPFFKNIEKFCFSISEYLGRTGWNLSRIQEKGKEKVDQFLSEKAFVTYYSAKASKVFPLQPYKSMAIVAAFI